MASPMRYHSGLSVPILTKSVATISELIFPPIKLGFQPIKHLLPSLSSLPFDLFFTLSSWTFFYPSPYFSAIPYTIFRPYILMHLILSNIRFLKCLTSLFICLHRSTYINEITYNKFHIIMYIQHCCCYVCVCVCVFVRTYVCGYICSYRYISI